MKALLTKGMGTRFALAALFLPFWFRCEIVSAQESGSPEASRENRPAEEHRRYMLEQLGIRRLRPEVSRDPAAPTTANYEESKANPFSELPDPLVTKDGRPLTTPEEWWRVRRPESVEDFERKVYGRIPPNVPKVRWSVLQAVETRVGTYPVRGRRLAG